MTALVEFLFLVHWCRTFNASSYSGAVYRQRVLVTTAMIVFMLVTGEAVGRSLFAVLSGWAVTIEVACFVLAVLDYDERLFPRKGTP